MMKQVQTYQINLAWVPPVNNGGSPIIGHKIERSTDNGMTWMVIVPNTGNTTPAYSDTGLLPNTNYTYRVSAINAVGASTPSNMADATTKGTNTISTELKLTQDEIATIRTSLPDLRHLHRENLDNASTTYE